MNPPNIIEKLTSIPTLPPGIGTKFPTSNTNALLAIADDIVIPQCGSKLTNIKKGIK